GKQHSGMIAHSPRRGNQFVIFSNKGTNSIFPTLSNECRGRGGTDVFGCLAKGKLQFASVYAANTTVCGKGATTTSSSVVQNPKLSGNSGPGILPGVPPEDHLAPSLSTTRACRREARERIRAQCAGWGDLAKSSGANTTAWLAPQAPSLILSADRAGAGCGAMAARAPWAAPPGYLPSRCVAPCQVPVRRWRLRQRRAGELPVGEVQVHHL
ncbi:unnamed protein product, partial [Prorocentrum cordatum]